MSKYNFKESILKRKICITIIIALLITSAVLFFQKQDYKYTLLYQHQTIPHIWLQNTLTESQGSMTGVASGFVKFDNLKDQPKDLRQYYIIKPLNKFDENLFQHYSIEEIAALPYVSPRSIGTEELVETNKTNAEITLADENGNKYFINKETKEITMRDATGDNTKLITSDTEYKNFIMEFLKK